MPLALSKLSQQFGQNLGFWDYQNVVHDLTDLHVPNTAGDRLRRISSDAKPDPSHQVLRIKHSNNMFWTALRIVNGNSRVLLLHDSFQGLVQSQIPRQRENIRPRHHHLAHRDVVQFYGLMYHLLLKRRDLSELTAGGYDQFQFVRRVHGPLTSPTRSKRAQNRPCRPAHHEEHRPSESEKDFHRRSDSQRHLF